MTPSRNGAGEIVGYHSNRRVPDRQILENRIMPLYAELLREEQRHTNRKDGMRASTEMVEAMLREQNMEYGEFIAKLAA